MNYLDNAATTYPKPRCVQSAVQQCLRQCGGNPGRSGHPLSLRAAETVYEAREAVNRLINGRDPARTVFTQNATAALNLAIKTSFQPGDELLISDLEHNAVLRPVEHLSRYRGVRYRVFATGGDLEQSIRSCIGQRTRGIVCTLVSNVTGQELPLSLLSRISRERGLLLIVDASQAIGHLPLDLRRTPCDVLCAPGHKGLFGIQGCGFAYFGDDRRRPTLTEGGSGNHSESLTMPEELPERFEPGTLPTPAIASLLAGIRMLEEEGIGRIGERCQRLTQAALERLESIPTIRVVGGANGVISIVAQGGRNAELSRGLERQGIAIRGGLHCAPLAHRTLGTLATGGTLRISLSYRTRTRQLDQLYRALRRLLFV